MSRTKSKEAENKLFLNSLVNSAVSSWMYIMAIYCASKDCNWKFRQSYMSKICFVIRCGMLMIFSVELTEHSHGETEIRYSSNLYEG